MLQKQKINHNYEYKKQKMVDTQGPWKHSQMLIIMIIQVASV